MPHDFPVRPDALASEMPRPTSRDGMTARGSGREHISEDEVRDLGTSRPAVTFAIASYNCLPYLADAVRSALDQRAVDVEVIIVDDASTDGSWVLAKSLAKSDNRIRAFRLPKNLGPAGARNVALDEARGRWFAILDSDDLLHPDRSSRLIEEALGADADMVADDLLLFDEARLARASLFLDRRRASRAGWIALDDYFRETRMFGPRPNLGFLKPIIRTSFLRRNKVRYDERLRIAEDDDLVVQALLRGARYRLLPEPYYFYRRHTASISHRLAPSDADRMLAASQRLGTRLEAGRKASRSFARRHRAMRRAWGYVQLLDAIKAHRPVTALSIAARVPDALLLMRLPVLARLRRLAGARAPSAPAVDPADLPIISRQRLSGATNGSSAYLLAIAGAAREAGFRPRLIQPSPLIFGRTPVYRLKPETRVFESIRIRGALRLGSWVLATQPAVYLAALRGIVSRLARRAGIGAAWARDRKAPYAVGAPWLPADRLFVARLARPGTRVALADYAFQAEGLPYLLAPAARGAIVMHDLFHARRAGFTDSADSVTELDAATEIDLLGRADAVVAIQADEIAFLHAHVPRTAALLAPMPAAPVAQAQPGEDDTLLFVGSNSAPNLLGLQWFFAEVWPIVRDRCPRLRLDVAGTVGAAMGAPPPGVRYLGLVRDLAPLYADAGIVISPLRQGSGLKIKLVEALAHGKACVVTGTTLQGVEFLEEGAVVRADHAALFAAALVRLSGDPAERLRLANAALEAARARFGRAACFNGFQDWLRREDD